MRSDSVEKREGIKLVVDLYLIGFSVEWISGRVKVCRCTAMSYLKKAGVYDGKRRRSQEETFQKAVLFYAEYALSRAANVLNTKVETVALHILGEWLGMEALQKSCDQYRLMAEKLLRPGYLPGQEGILFLLQYVFEKKFLGDLWLSYLQSLTRGRISIPKNQQMLQDSLASFVADSIRPEITPGWNADVDTFFDDILGKLTSREEQVVRNFCGIGCQKRTLAEIPAILDLKVTQERIRQIFTKAVKKLQEPRIRKSLEKIWRVGEFDYESGIFDNSLSQNIAQGGYDPRILKFPVSSLDFTARDLRIFENEGIKILGDLVEKSSSDLLKLVNFGRKLLNKTEDLLAEKGLSLAVTKIEK